MGILLLKTNYKVLFCKIHIAEQIEIMHLASNKNIISFEIV